MDPITRLYLIRHAEVEVRYQRVFGGWIDMELSPRGHVQATVLADYLRRLRLDAIYASPMKRVQQTLSSITAHHPARPIILDNLREVNFGVWTGLTWEQVHEQHQVRAFDWLEHLANAAIPEAESAEQFRQRLAPCLEKVLGESHGRSAAVVCHGGVIRMLLSMLLKLPIHHMARFDVEYASVTQVDCLAHKTEIKLLNFTPWRDLP